VHIQPAFKMTPRRYLTLIYGFTLGLALLLAILAIRRQDTLISDATSPAQPVLSPTSTSTPESTQASLSSTPTPLPLLPSTPNEETPSALGVTSADLDGLEVSLWHPWKGTAEAALQASLDEFNRTNQWGIRLQATGYEGFGSLDEALDSALRSDTLPDLVADYGYQARYWDGYDALADLNPYVNDPAWGLSDADQADFFPAFWQEDLMYEGSSGQARRLAVPYYRSAYMLFYNLTWARELGYPSPPGTPEAFLLQACAAAEQLAIQGEPTSIGQGGWLVTPQPAALLGWIYAFGGSVTAADGVDYQFNTAAAQQALEFIHGLRESGCAWSAAEVEAADELANRRALFVVGSLLDIRAQQESFAVAGSTDEWTVLPFPSRGQPVVISYGPSLMVTRSTPPRQLAAWMVIEWLVYPLNQAGWAGALGVYPTRNETVAYLKDMAGSSPQWEDALELLPVARSEPSLASWSVMRWALQDALLSLFDAQLGADQVPSLLERLDSLAAEIADQVR
jgi:multiple sugar transport system substrate-binding protein